MAKQSDAGSVAVIAKIWTSVTFDGTFSVAPKVVVATTAENKKCNVRTITTTGCEVYSEDIGTVHWIAREAGYE